MATTQWSAAWEALPAGTENIFGAGGGRGRIYELKISIRERLVQGGHYMQDTVAGFAKDGRHVVGVGASSGPHIFKSDATTKLVNYTDTMVSISEKLTVSNTTELDGSTWIYNSLRLLAWVSIDSGDTPYTALENYPNIFADTTGGNITVNMPAIGAGNDASVWFVHKTVSANALTLDAAGSDTFVYGTSASRATVVTNTNAVGTFMLIADNTTKKWFIVACPALV